MTTSPTRDTFSLRFKKPENREALRRIAELTGMSMTDVAEQAIEHEVVLLAYDLEERLSEALEVVRGYRAERDFERYVRAAAEGERSGLDPMRRASRQGDTEGHASAGDPFDVVAAFARS